MSDPPEPDIAITVAHAAWTAAVSDPAAVCSAAARVALGAVSAPDASTGTVSILLADDARLCGLNRQFRGVDRPTNVLAFPSGPNPDDFLGDIAVAFETSSREAADADISLADHLSHLVIHGTLHLLGHDHVDPGEAEAMETLERALLDRLGIADPYAETVLKGAP